MDDVISIMAMSNSKSKAGNDKVNVPDLKKNLHALSKKKLDAAFLN